VNASSVSITRCAPDRFPAQVAGPDGQRDRARGAPARARDRILDDQAGARSEPEPRHRLAVAVGLGLAKAQRGRRIGTGHSLAI
jgi:hypothetical protein